jgi:phosphorylcholine metabolism protein LicD
MKKVIEKIINKVRKPREKYWSLYIKTKNGNYFEIVHENRMDALKDKESLESEGFEVEILEQSDYSPWHYAKEGEQA